MSFFYPKLDEATLKNLDIVRQLAQAHPGYFLESEYSSQTNTLLQEWFTTRLPVSGTVPEIHMDDRDPWEMLYEESKNLFFSLKAANLKGSGDVNEQNSYFRTATALLEKLVSLQERAKGLKEIGEFQRTVMEVMDSVLTANQRALVMERFNTIALMKDDSNVES